MKKKTLYICTFRHDTEMSLASRRKSCAQCTHAYPHEHTDGCDGDCCPNSNEHNPNIEDYMTCQPIVDKKQVFKSLREQVLG